MTVSSTTTRNSYTGNGSTTVFAYGFKIFDDDDITVILRTTATGAETVQTKTTHYSVSGVGDAGGGNITFGTAPTSAQTVVLLRQTAQTQTTDYTPNDPFPASSHEDALDKLTLLAQDQQDELDRAIKLSRTNTMTSTEFTVGATDRANKILAFDSSGELAVTQEIGTFQGTDATTTTAPYNQRDLIKSTTAAQLNNVYICIADSVAGDLLTDTDHFELLVDAVSAATSATNAASSETAAGNSETAAEAARDLALSYRNTAETHKNDAESAKDAAVIAQAAAEAALDTFDDRFLGAKSSDPTLDNDGNALLDGALYFDTTANLMKVYDQSGAQWVQLALTGTNQTNVNLVAGQISPTNNISTVAGAITAGSFAEATNFSAKYRTGSTDPTDSLDAGDLFFNTTSNTLKVYNGSGWVNATLQGATITTFEYTATAGQTAFTGNDDNGDSLNYNTANALVTINGVIIPTSDYTTTSATTLTLDADAAAEVGDSVIIISYSEFSASTANIVTDTSPELGGNLDVNGNSIVSTSNGDINITPNGSGKVKVDNVSIDGNTIASEDTNGDLILSPNGSGDVEVNSDTLNLNYTDDGSSAGPYLRLNRVSASPADSDEIGRIEFNANDSAGNETTYASITGRTDDVTNSSEDGRLRFFVRGTTSGTGGYSTMSLRSSSGTAHLSFGGNARIHWGDWGGSALDGDLYLRPYIAQNFEEVNNTRTIELPDESGLLSYVEQHRTSASDVAEIDFDNLPTLFESYVFKYRLHPVSDNDYLKIQFLDSSGTVIAGTSYGYSRVQNGSHVTSNTSAAINSTSGNIGNNSYEGIRGEVVLLGRNYIVDDTDSVPPTVVGQHSFINGSGTRIGGTYQGGLHTTSQQAIRGIRFSFNTGNIDSGVISIAGIQEAV